MTVQELRNYLADCDGALKVNVIFNGKIDANPELNVVENTLYIEGVAV